MTLPPFITKYLKKLSPKKGGAYAHPSRDWLILLGGSLLVLVASIAWNVWFFASVLEGEEVAVPGGGEETLEQSSVEKANKAFEERSGEQNRYRTEYRFVDPSR